MGDEIFEGYDRITAPIDYFAEPKLVAWKVKVGLKESNRVSRAALKIGSKVDAIIKGIEKLRKSDPIEVHNCIESFERWVKDYNVNKSDLVFPQRFFDKEKMITGEADCLWKRILIDFKGAARLSRKYWMQTCAYSQYYPCDKVAILRFGKNTSEYYFKTNEDIGLNIADGILAYEGILNAYRFLKEEDTQKEEDANGTDQNSPSNQEVGSR